MSETKLDWVYDTQSGEQRAEYKGIVIRAIRDEAPEDPFTAQDGHWPMLALPGERYSKIAEYGKVPGLAIGAVLGRFNDAALIHDQKAIAQALNSTIIEATSHVDRPSPVWCRDAATLREGFENLLYDLSDNKRFDALEALYKLLGIPVLNTTVHGYSQGDQTDLLIVATPEAQEALRSKPTDTDDEAWARTLKDDMESQAKLYQAWAFGDVYGYQLARRVPDPAENDETGHCVECGRDNSGHEGEPCLWDGQVSDDNCPMYDNGQNTTLEDIDSIDASCWGYYGSDFDWSGLEEAAIDAAEMFVKESVR